MIGAVAAGPVGLLVGLKLSGCAGCIVAGGALGEPSLFRNMLVTLVIDDFPLGAFGGRVIQKKVGGEMEFLQEETPVAVNSSCSAADKKSN